MRRHLKEYYECHVTFKQQPGVDTKAAVQAIGWTYSAIDGDPILGDGVKAYATKHFNKSKPLQDVKDELDIAAGELRTFGAAVIRKKIELVVYDEF